MGEFDSIILELRKVLLKMYLIKDTYTEIL